MILQLKMDIALGEEAVCMLHLIRRLLLKHLLAQYLMTGFRHRSINQDMQKFEVSIFIVACRL